MTALLDVETADFLDASRSMTQDVGDPLAHAVTQVQVALGECGAMAGADPAGTAWAVAYDKAAGQALDAGEGVVNATYHLGAMLEQSARNYAAANAASGGHPASVPHAGMFAQSTVGVGGRPPSAHGGAGSTPNGWTLVEGIVGRVWPDGHQGRLLAAASAWEVAAGSLTDRADSTMLAGIPFARDRLPEADDMCLVCRSVAAHVREVASVFRQVAGSCRDLAHHLDAAHSQVEHELISLAAQTAAIETAGAALSAISLGAAEAPTQAVEAGRIAAAAARIRELLDAFALLARAATLRVVVAADRASAVAGRSRAVLGARISAAEVQLAARYPRLAQGMRERLAIYRLSPDAGHIRLRFLDDPHKFDPHSLRGTSAEELRTRIPPGWTKRRASRGDGEVYSDPNHRGRQIRIMRGYPSGSRPDSIATGGPYAVVSQAGQRPIKVPLAGNEVLK